VGGGFVSHLVETKHTNVGYRKQQQQRQQQQQLLPVKTERRRPKTGLDSPKMNLKKETCIKKTLLSLYHFSFFL
jgi:hypothetical protein